MKNEFNSGAVMDIVNQKIIQAVIDARKSTNLTQKELAERIGIAQSDI